MSHKLVSSLAVAVVSLMTSLPATATVVSPIMLVKRMKSHGVNTVEKPICIKEEFNATYNRVTNVFCMTSDLFNGNPQKLLDTVTHEAVHVIQDCLAGGLSSPRSITITDYIVSRGLKTRTEAGDMFIRQVQNAGLTEHVYFVAKRAQNKHHATAEIEAYALQNLPHKVYDLLQKSCG